MARELLAAKYLMDDANNEKLTVGQRVSDWVTALVGSWRFIIIQSTVLGGWVIANGVGLIGFDPYPFILLNLLLSFQAAYTAPFIMMSQNRQSMKDRQTIEKDLELNFTELDLNLREEQTVSELRDLFMAWQEKQDVSDLREEVAALHDKLDRLLQPKRGRKPAP